MNGPLPVRDDQLPFEPRLPYLANLNRQSTKPRAVHTHPGVELGLATEGSGVMYLAGRDYPFERGDVFFVDAGIPHWHYGAKDSPFAHIWIALPPETLVALSPRRGDPRLYVPFIALRHGLSPAIKRNTVLQEHIRTLHTLFEERPSDWDLLAWPHLAATLVGIAEHAGMTMKNREPALSNTSAGAVINAIQYLAEHFQEQVSVAHLARLCNLSPSRFSHLFTEVMRTSPIQYRNQLRISYALECLSATTDTVHAIALDCGYQSLSQFRDAFVKATGMPPGEYRRRLRE